MIISEKILKRNKAWLIAIAALYNAEVESLMQKEDMLAKWGQATFPETTREVELKRRFILKLDAMRHKIITGQKINKD